MKERQELIQYLRERVNIGFDNFTYKVVNEKELDYCDEMALMYNMEKYLQYIEHNEEIFNNKELEILTKYERNFVDEYLDIYWNSDLGNSYTDIKYVLKEMIREYNLGGIE